MMTLSNYVHPLWLDGPLAGLDHPVTEDQIREQLFRVRDGNENRLYTFTRVTVFGRVIVVASTGNSLPEQSLLFDRLISAAGKKAAEDG